jgi:glycosyltransferase involved in cell wall biosynthesis
VKDPFRAARAVRDLPPESRIQVHHVGRALTGAMAKAARRESEINARYQWLGEVPHWQSRRLIARARVLVLSSKMEGGASVVAEAVVNRTPVIASRISGTRGMLGDDYPGFFSCGDTTALRDLLLRFESVRPFASQLRRWCDGRRAQFSQQRERRSLRQLVNELDV